MKGSNTLIFNQATMVEIVQQWLVRSLTASAGVQVVQRVKFNGADGTFDVEVKGAEETSNG